MSIASAIQTKQQQVAAAYTACNNKGATIPQTQDLTNLATCIGTIQTGGSSPVISSLTITPTTSQQTITAPSGTDGYSPITVNAVTASIDANIIAGNIKNGVNILGVIGTYEGSGSMPDSAIDPSTYIYGYDIMNISSYTNAQATYLDEAKFAYATTSNSSNAASITSLSSSNLEVMLLYSMGIYWRYYTNLATVNFPKLKYVFGEYFLRGSSTYKNTTITGMLSFPELYGFYVGNYPLNFMNNLQKLSVPKLKVILTNRLIQNCPNLKYVNASSFTDDIILIGSGCLNMECLIVGDFDNRTNLFLQVSSGNNNYPNFSTYVLNVTKVPTIATSGVMVSGSSAFPKFVSGGTGKIYVPDNLVNAFKTATNWSALAEFIKPMSQWTNPYE